MMLFQIKSLNSVPDFKNILAILENCLKLFPFFINSLLCSTVMLYLHSFVCFTKSKLSYVFFILSVKQAECR